MRSQLLLVLGVLIAVTLVALALGATNLGTALAFGQMAFAAAVVWVIVRGRS